MLESHLQKSPYFFEGGLDQTQLYLGFTSDSVVKGHSCWPLGDKNGDRDQTQVSKCLFYCIATPLPNHLTSVLVIILMYEKTLNIKILTPCGYVFIFRGKESYSRLVPVWLPNDKRKPKPNNNIYLPHLT